MQKERLLPLKHKMRQAMWLRAKSVKILPTQVKLKALEALLLSRRLQTRTVLQTVTGLMALRLATTHKLLRAGLLTIVLISRLNLQISKARILLLQDRALQTNIEEIFLILPQQRNLPKKASLRNNCYQICTKEEVFLLRSQKSLPTEFLTRKIVLLPLQIITAGITSKYV